MRHRLAGRLRGADGRAPGRFPEGPSTALSRAERCEVVRAALEKLHPIDREILALRYFDDLSFTQIGAILDLKENTANTRALRAAMKLRRLIPSAFRPPGASQP